MTVLGAILGGEGEAMVTDEEIQELIAMGEGEAGTAEVYRDFDRAYTQYVSVVQPTAVHFVQRTDSQVR